MGEKIMTISEFKEKYSAEENNRYYFSRDTLKFFEQKMSDFSVHKVNNFLKEKYFPDYKDDDIFVAIAPSYYRGRLMGHSTAFFDNTINHSLSFYNKKEFLIDMGIEATKNDD